MQVWTHSDTCWYNELLGQCREALKVQREFEKKSTNALELSTMLASVKWLIPSLDKLVFEVFEFDASLLIFSTNFFFNICIYLLSDSSTNWLIWSVRSIYVFQSAGFEMRLYWAVASWGQTAWTAFLDMGGGCPCCIFPAQFLSLICQAPVKMPVWVNYLTKKQQKTWVFLVFTVS